MWRWVWKDSWKIKRRGGGYFYHQFNELRWIKIKIKRGTATPEVDRRGAAPTYRLTLRARYQTAPGQAFGHCALCVHGLHRLLKMSARRSFQNQSHTELCHHLWQGEQDTHTVGTHRAWQSYHQCSLIYEINGSQCEDFWSANNICLIVGSHIDIWVEGTIDFTYF